MSVCFRRTDWAIVLIATRGLAAFVENALLTIERCGIDASLVELVIPANAERELAGVAHVFGAKPRILERLVDVQFEIPTTYAEYGSRAFNNLMKYRFPALRTIMAEGRRVIYADVDVAWLCNALPYLSDVLDRFPCAFQTEPLAVFPPEFCLGFFALADTPAALKLVDHFISRYAGNELRRPSQKVFRDLIIENPQYLADIFPLPEGLFPHGLLYRVMETGHVPPVVSRQLRPFIFHGNWVQGLDKKHRLLAHTGVWLVPENARVAGPIRLGDPIELFSMTDFYLHNGAEMQVAPSFEVITPGPQWSRALSFLINPTTAQSICSDQSVTINMELRVTEGGVGIGLLKDDGEFIVEKVIPSSKKYKDLALRAPMSEKISEIIIRNCSETGTPSRVTIRSIGTRSSQRSG